MFKTMTTKIREHLWYIQPLDNVVIETFKLNTLVSALLNYVRGEICNFGVFTATNVEFKYRDYKT